MTMELPFADNELSDRDTGLGLVVPGPAYLESYVRACEETWDHIHNRYILHDPARACEWRETIFRTFEKRARGEELPPGYYPSLMLWTAKDGEFVGAVNIRLASDEALISYGGTLGYFVRTPLRGRGYGAGTARLGLRAARLLGVDPLVITCTEDNAASLALARSLPALRSERDVVPVDGIVQPIWRFWF